jgi:SPP1 family predicted phage head-tail adaptor
MSRCKSIQPQTTKICAADFNRKITLQHAASIANNNPNQNAGSAFLEIKTCWAMAKTVPNAEFKNETNINQGITIDFYIRYDSKVDLGKSIWVEFNSNKYKVTEIENIDLKNEILRLRAVERGNKNFAGNLR